MAVPHSNFTPKSILSLIVEMIAPDQSRVHDPAMGSDGLFITALPCEARRSLPQRHSADRCYGRINLPVDIKEWWYGKLERDAR